MNFEELFGRNVAAGNKDGASRKPNVSSPIMNVANLAFNQARSQDLSSNSNLGDKSPIIHSRTFSETIGGSLRGMKPFSSEATESPNQSDSSGSSSEETESSDSSITRVEQVKPKVKAGLGSEIGGATRSLADGQEANTDTAPKKSRAKVSSNMIISDFSSIRLPQKKQQGQYEDSTLSENYLERYDGMSEVSRSSDPGRNSAFKVKPPENTINTRQRRTNSISGDSPLNASFESNPNAIPKSEFNYTRSDISRRSDSGQNTNPKKPGFKSNIFDNHSNYDRNFNNNEWSKSYSPKSKASSLVSYNTSSPHHGGQRQLNPRYNSKTQGTDQTWSEVPYYPKETRANVINQTAPNPLRGDLRQHKPKVSMNAMMDVTSTHSDNFENRPRREQQLDHIIKVENLIDVLTKKISEQEADIKNLKDKLGEVTEETQKVRANLFYDPKMLPINSLPRLIFER
ncbi:15683_t:CDS:2, partial [Acaulospora colombiana]